ncbi:MAG TPA: helix-turn-helix domain-containing protein [Geobacteraceae bacterium]
MNRGSVGSFLREEREARGIALEEAVRVTRIGKNYLTALEDGRFDTIPNTAYVKGFLRAYAAFLGLSGDDVVGMYERAVSPPPSNPVEEKVNGGISPAGKMKASRRGRRVITLVLLALVVVTAYVFDDRGTRQEKRPPAPEPAPAVRTAAPVLPVRSSAQRAPAAPAAIAEKDGEELRPSPAEHQVSGIVLKLKVNQDCSLNITIDDAVSQQYDLKAGDLIEWKGERVFTLDLGNAGGVEAEFNGKPLKTAGEQGQPVHLVLKADGA